MRWQRLYIGLKSHAGAELGTFPTGRGSGLPGRRQESVLHRDPYLAISGKELVRGLRTRRSAAIVNDDQSFAQIERRECFAIAPERSRPTKEPL